MVMPTKSKNLLAKPFYSDETWLREHYIDFNLSVPEIAKFLDCDSGPIYKFMNLYNIERRSISEALHCLTEETIQRRHDRISSARKGNGHLHTEEEKLKISRANSGKKFNQEHKNKLKQAWIVTRPKRSGEYSYLWKGGISFGKYCKKFNNYTKNLCRNDFNRKCFICGKDEQDNSEQLCIHHIDYNKMQGCSNKKWNLIPLCRTCHASTNSNRWFWFNLLNNYWIIKVDQTICFIYDIDIYRTMLKYW